ncbi:MAG: sensor histidine kinase [Solirubrobacteraceae bacterium MAG38_C4-C5]|nr:sensor histidine kinase [Candidatus Siliceabacter maunaloa]
MTDPSPGWGARGVALLRLLLVPIVFLIERNDPQAWSPQADLILLAAGLYAAVALALTSRSSPAPRGGWRPYAVADLTFLGLLAWQSGGAFSEVRAVLAALPFVVAFVGRPRSTAILAALGVIVYVVAAEAPAGAPDRGYVASEALLLAWGGTLAVLLSLVITRGRDQVLSLAAERQRLLADTQSATDRERQRLAYRLHDNAIQSLQAARLQLSRLERGHSTALDGVRAAITDAVDELRTTVADLRPADVERVGLSNALHQTALRLLEDADDAAPQLDIAVAPDTEGIDDELCFAIARELLTNAIAHSHASHITLTLARDNGHLSLEVDDDGHGIAPGRRRQARREGHIGLAACTERAASHGGTLDITSHPDRGTTVTVALPLTRPSDRPHESSTSTQDTTTAHE